MIDVWPSSLLLTAAYGVVETASTALFGPLVGQWVDKFTYKKVFTGLEVLVPNYLPSIL